MSSLVPFVAVGRLFAASRRHFLRVAALLTLTVFVGARIGEALHNLCKNHDETHCAICQIAHHTPAAQQNGITITSGHEYSRIVAEVFSLRSALVVPERRSRSPPAA